MGVKAVHYTESDIQKARGIDLLTYLRSYEPDNLVKVKGMRNVYCTAEHDSLKISNGKWMWWSRGIGGVSALDYLTKVRGFSFQEAMYVLVGDGTAPARSYTPPPKTVQKKEPPKKFRLPQANPDCRRVKEYLTGRGLDPALVEECIKKGLIFENLRHEAVFVGRDQTGRARFAAQRGTDSDVKKDVSGSDKRYAFKLAAYQARSTVHVFEGAVDALSYASLLTAEGFDWHRENLLSLSGVAPSRDGHIAAPKALQQFLKDNPNTKTVYLHLDNDKAGRLATKGLQKLLGECYRVVDAPAPVGKDFNDFLMAYRKQEQVKKPSLMKRLQEGRDKLARGPIIPAPARTTPTPSR